MAKVLIVDIDTKEMRTIKQILESRDGHTVAIASTATTEESGTSPPVVVPSSSPEQDSPNQHLLLYASSVDTMAKMLNEQRINLVFVGTRILDDTPENWVKRVRGMVNRAENKAVSICFLNHLEDPASIRNFISPDIADVIVLPIDAPLFIQKFDLWVTGKVNSSDRQLYALQTKSPIDVAVISSIEEISEFGVVVKTTLPVQVGECVVFYAEAFAESGRGEAIGRCYSVSPHPTEKAFSIASFSYIGVMPSTLRSVRKWVRQQYALKKQQGD